MLLQGSSFPHVEKDWGRSKSGEEDRPDDTAGSKVAGMVLRREGGGAMERSGRFPETFK